MFGILTLALLAVTQISWAMMPKIGIVVNLRTDNLSWFDMATLAYLKDSSDYMLAHELAMQINLRIRSAPYFSIEYGYMTSLFGQFQHQPSSLRRPAVALDFQDWPGIRNWLLTFPNIYVAHTPMIKIAENITLTQWRFINVEADNVIYF